MVPTLYIACYLVVGIFHQLFLLKLEHLFLQVKDLLGVPEHRPALAGAWLDRRGRSHTVGHACQSRAESTSS